jgi:CheY-like chemotaxis protein
MAQIFEPFFTTKETDKGTGLGLSMVFGFMRQSGGHVSVDSEPGVGTSFKLYLPRSYAVAAPEAAPDIRPAAHVTGECVLVVEDKPAMRRITVRQLCDLGYRVLEADRAAAALEMLQREHVDLLLTDIVMAGGLDGVELARLAQEGWPALKVVLTSGFAQVRVNGNGDVLGNLPLLSKPYTKDELAAALRAALGLAD